MLPVLNMVADNRCCCCSLYFKCYSCCSEAGPEIVLEGFQVSFSFIKNYYHCQFLWCKDNNLCICFWRGIWCSNFAEIFDVDWFISFLSKDVEIIKQLPTKGGKPMSPYTMRVPRKCNAKCYQNRVVPVLNKKHVSVFHIECRTFL